MTSTPFAGAVELVKGGKLKEAEEILLGIESFDPDFINAQIMLGVVCFEAKQWERAEWYLREATKDENRVPVNQRSPVRKMLELAQARKGYTEQEFMAHQFDGFAPKYERANADAGNVACQQCVDAVARFLKPEWRKELVALDLCCGTGQTGPLLSRALEGTTLTLTGIDLSAKSIALAREKQVYNNLIVGDAARGDLEADRLDAVISVDAFYFFPELETIFAKVARALKVGGCLCFNMPVPEGDDVREVWYGLNRHYHYPRSKVVRDADAVGLVPAEIIETSAYVSRAQGKIPAFIYVLRKD